jgi:hypothetical protein
MKAPLVLTSSLESLNVAKLFKLVFLKVFDLPIDLVIVTEGAIVEGFTSSITTSQPALPLNVEQKTK